MGTSKRYNSVSIKENCALFAPTLIFLGPGYPMVSSKFLPCRPLLPRQRILGQNNSAPVKDNCALFAPTPPYTQLLGYIA